MNKKDVLVEISARHMHVTQEHLEILFGSGATLTPIKDLSQPNQFACAERVDVVGPRNMIKGVTILGPTRPETQVEVSLTEARQLGIKAQVRMSGSIEGTEGCKLVGPKGEVVIEKGLIAAKRHIHFNDDEAKEFGVADNEVVMVKVTSDSRSLVFDDVVIRVNKNFKAAMHIDTDEANAAGLTQSIMGEIIKKTVG
jgi:putative phosphotransacetylase